MTIKRILVVDDDPALQGSLQVLLESNGHIVETAENGREALARLDHAGYDAVLRDYIMPEINGLAVLRHIRQHHPLLPVVMMTGERGTQVAAQSLLALGAWACLFKPFDPRDLEQVLQFGANPEMPETLFSTSESPAA